MLRGSCSFSDRGRGLAASCAAIASQSRSVGIALLSTRPLCGSTPGRLIWLMKWMTGGLEGYSGPQLMRSS